MAKANRPDRNAMPAQPGTERIRNFNEVALGYDEEMALSEASRCLQCKNPLCEQGCPVQVQIRDFITLVTEKDYMGAYNKIVETNSLPAICGRVCPQEEQCEEKCILGIKDKPVAIGRLERFVSDYAISEGVQISPGAQDMGRVAIVGAGPAGLTAAGDLARMGHEVTVLEALHEAGGVLIYGIPEFRLPKAIVKAEVENLEQLGVEVKTNVIVGKTILLDELLEEYDAVFLGTGAGLPRFMGIDGENLNGVYSANEWLTRSNLMKAYRFPEYDTPIIPGKKVVVVGAGNVAMDAVRSALRLGAEEAHIVYRRSETEMTARLEEYEHAIEEGIQFHWLTNPTRILGDDKGWVKAVECIKMELGEPDASGRRRPIAIEGSEFTMECDTVVMALGTRPNPVVVQSTEGLDTHSWGGLIVDDELQTTKAAVWAGGDAVTGAATVILAAGAGKQAAVAIDEYIRDKKGLVKKNA